MHRLLIILVLFLVTTPSAAQRSQARMLIGISGYTLAGDGVDEADFIYRLAGGAGLSYELLPLLSVRTELRYTIQGGRMNGTVDGAIEGEPTAIPVEATFDLTYLEIPVLLVLGLDLVNNHRLEIGVGPGVGLKVDTRTSFAAATGPEFSQALDAPGRTTAFTFAVDYSFRMGSERVILGLRGWRSRTKAGLETTVPGTEDVYTQGLSFLTGLTF
ncbi:MAG: outer membrane beta-barrel protein [Rhodothermales bacterium]|nr:outer membrane beta-barrel protein [Rhodothermales bacterium]